MPTCTNGHDAPEGHCQVSNLKARGPAAPDAKLLGENVWQIVEELGVKQRKENGEKNEFWTGPGRTGRRRVQRLC
eukprot:1159971-Pelagomonas_calceolata.AAC.3